MINESPFSNFNIDEPIKGEFLIADSRYYTFLALLLAFMESLFNSSLHEAVEIFQGIPIPSSVFSINLACVIKSHFEVFGMEFFENFLSGLARLRREVDLHGSVERHIYLAIVLIFRGEEDLEQATGLLLPSDESARSQGYLLTVYREEVGRIIFCFPVKFYDFFITCQMSQF